MAQPARSAGIRVEGARRLRKTMKQAGQDLGQLKEAHAEAASIAGRRAQGTAPVGATGNLSRSVRWSGTTTSATIRAGRASVRYAPPIHWGWPRRGISPQPWITEAARATEPAWSAAYGRAVDRVLKTIKGV